MEKIFVSIRVRPLSKVEASKGSPWKLGSNSITLCNATGAPIPGQSYSFDKVFDPESSTLEIYETHTKDIIASAVKGFNGTVFAYGQTSSGKTYTMRGSSREPGIIPLAVQEIFRNIEEAEDREFLLRVSYMEIYNEEINDLLAPENRKLQVHENVERGIFVAGLREEIVVSPEQVLDLMTAGETYRHVGETNMNVYSSRSHSIFRMVIESRDKSHDDPAASVQSCDAVRVSVLNLVDLAGSERIAKTGAEGARLKEGTHINKSLMTLGTVINKLSEGVEKQGGHVPYRDSKLTRILQPALGGNAKTAVICNITPAQIHVDETKGTLFFASRANRVTNCAQVNEIMTDAALLKRQKKEIEELRNKLQENHSEHWDAEILNLRNALLKTELERERMALELQQEKAAQAERERRLKEQQRKIDNLSTMVINSAVDDRDIDRKNKKNNRRETWCPRIPSNERNEQPQESKIPFPKESPLVKSMFSTRRERLPPLPPPFESLMESEEEVLPLTELNENAFGEDFQSFPSDGSNLDSIFQEPPPVVFCERKRRSSQKSMDDDVRRQLEDLQAQYEDLQLQHELKMREKMSEMKELREELAFAQSAANKVRKLDDVISEGDRRGKSLDGWEFDANVHQLRAQVRPYPKLFKECIMQKELDTLKEQAKTESSSAHTILQKLQQELEESRKDAARAKLDLSFAIQKILELQYDQQSEMKQQAALAAHFNELTLEVETTKSTSQAFYDAAMDSTNALRATLANLQESVTDVKSLRAAADNQHLGSLQSDLEDLVKEHDSLFSVLQAVRTERDAFCEVARAAQADLKSLEEETRGRNHDLEAARSDLLATNEQIVELQSLSTQLEDQGLALKKRIAELEDEARGAISKAHKENLEERIAQLEQELGMVAQEKASLKSEGEAMHATIQVLKGEWDALIETSRQAQADIDRLQGKRRQESKEAQDKLEAALSESYHAKEQLIAMRSLLSEKTEDEQALQLKLVNLQKEVTTSTNDLEEKIQALETQLAHKSMTFASTIREYEELVVNHEVLNRETSELREVCNSSFEEVNRLCKELNIQEQAVAEAEKRLESGRVQVLEYERQLSELHLTISEQNADLETLRRKVANLSAEKSAIETCLAGHTPESLDTVLVEKSLQLSTAECSLQSTMAELKKIKQECTVLQDLRITLETELAEARAYSAAVEETLSEAVNTLESTNQDKQNLKAGLENALKESDLKSAKLADIENECAALVESMESIKLEMEDAKNAWEQEVQNQKESNEVASLGQLALVEECKSLRSDLLSLEEEREVLKEQNFQAERELKELDIEVQRQCQEIEVAERDLEVAKEESMRAAEIIADLRESSAQKADEIMFLRSQVEDFGMKMSSLEGTLEEKVPALEFLRKREDTLTLEIRSAQRRFADLEHILLEKDEKIKDLSTDLVNLQSVHSGMEEDIKNKVAEMEQLVHLTSTERAVFEESHEAAENDLRKIKEERDKLLLMIQDLEEGNKLSKQLLSDEESRFGNAESTISSANSHILELQELLSKKNAELEQLEQEKNGLVERMTATEKSLREELERNVQEVQAVLSEQTAKLERLQLERDGLVEEMTAVEHALQREIEEKVDELQALSRQKYAELELAEQERSRLAASMTVAHQSVREELESTIQNLEASVSNFEAVNLEAHENLKQLESLLSENIEEKERVIKEKEVLLDATAQLQEKILCLEREGEEYRVELKQMESRVASMTSEIDDAGKQLSDVHSLLIENQKERLVLQHGLEELENIKAGLQNSLSSKDAELASTSAALSEVKTKFEAFQQQHSAESSQLKSDILALRKELKAAKAAPGALEKERDGLRKDLEKLKTKLGDIEAKLKSTLVEKSKVETEKLNIEREVKQLRQSTALLNKRESIVDKRRESVACGLSKTKQQLSSTEHALQMKNNELEKTAFDLQLLQDNYAKLEADLVETENASSILKSKLAEAESAISVLEDEKAAVTSTVEKVSQQLEDELEEKRNAVAQLDSLRSELTAMTEKLLASQVASEKIEAELKAISLERDDFASQLTDAHCAFEEEKAAWASQVGQSDAKVQELQQEVSNVTEVLRKVQQAQEEAISTRNSLQVQLDEAEHATSTARVAFQEQLSKLEHSLTCSEQESNELRQQVALLTSNIEEQVQLQRKLQGESLIAKEQYEALKDEFEKLKELLNVAEADIQRERQISVDLAEEVRQLNRMLQDAEQRCADLNSGSEALARKDSDERLQLLEERRALSDRCTVLEEQISQFEVSFRKGKQNETMLLQEIQDLKEEYRNNIGVLSQRKSSEDNHRAIELEATWKNDREVAQKQVAKLQSQLKMSHAEIESLQSELDEVSMKVKSLNMEVDDLQADKSMLKQQLAGLTGRLSSLEAKNEQLQEKEIHLLQLQKAYLTSKMKLQFALDATAARLEIFQSLCEKMEEVIKENDEQKTTATKQNERLLLKLQKLGSRCQRYEEELKEARSTRVSPEEEQDRENQKAEIMQQNSALQLRLQKAEELAKARREEMMKLNGAVQRKEEANVKLETALEKAQSRLLKLERDLYQKSELQTTRKVEGSTFSSGDFTTPVASRHEQESAIHTDDTNVLYSNSLASRGKVEQLMLQSQSLLRMSKQPWRIQGSPGSNSDETGDHPPPSATLDSHRENLTAPIPTWKRAKTAGATSTTEPFVSNNSTFNDDKLRAASTFSTRSVPRAALLPVNTQNRLQTLGLKRRLQEADKAESKPSVSSSSHMPPFNRGRYEKENV